MNVYDFDGTLYKGDSTFDFYKYIVRKRPEILKALPPFLLEYTKYKFGIVDKTTAKEKLYKYLTYFKKGEIEKLVLDFWKTHKKNIFPYYKKKHKANDVVISASPRFLLEPICKKLKIKTLICSEVNKNTGKYKGINCRDVEKMRRFFEKFPRLIKSKKPIDEFYSDSNADLPLAKISKAAYKVDGRGNIAAWKFDCKE